VAEIVHHSHNQTKVVKNPSKIFDNVSRKLSPSRSNITVVDDFGHLFLPQIVWGSCLEPLLCLCVTDKSDCFYDGQRAEAQTTRTALQASDSEVSVPAVRFVHV
jgi:hypothetical protein